MGEGRYRHLSFEEREQVAIWRLEGVSQAEMARRLGRPLSTINRELARNRRSCPWRCCSWHLAGSFSGMGRLLVSRSCWAG